MIFHDFDWSETIISVFCVIMVLVLCIYLSSINSEGGK